MNFSDRPQRFDEPGQCIVLPGRIHDENGGVQLDGVYDGLRGDMRLWISYAGLQRIVDQFGDRLNLAKREALREAEVEAAGLRAELAMQTERAEAAEAKLERINGVAKDGFKVSRQQGRPPQKKVPANA